MPLGISDRNKRNENLQKTKNSPPTGLFLFSNTVDFKNSNRQCRKQFLNVVFARIAAINLFQLNHI